MAQQKIPTGIAGLDHLLKGGLLPNASVMVEGTPGTGKSTLGVQFIAEGIAMGQPGIIVTLEEYPSEFYRDALNYGWDLAAWEREHKLRVIATSPQALKQQVESGGPLADEIHGIGAKRIIIDSMNQFERITTDRSVLRTMMSSMIHAFKIDGLISLFTKDMEEQGGLEYWGRYSVDVLIELSFVLMKGRERHRFLEIHKARGQDHVLGRNSFKITDRGIQIFPRPALEAIMAAREEAPALERVTSGIEGFDQMLGGGFIRGQSVLLAGSAGTGKSLGAASFANAGLREGQGTLYISMEDPPDRIMQNAAAVGIDLLSGVKSGLIEMLYLPPVELSADELLYEVESRLDTGKFQRLVIDSISSLQSVTTETEYLYDVVLGLAGTCHRRLITGVFIAEIEQMTGPFRFTEFGGSFIADAVVLLRLVEVGGVLRKAISVIKMRASAHDPSLRELSFTKNGLRAGPQFENLSGLLTGVATAQHGVGFEAYFGEVTQEQSRIASALEKSREATAEEIAGAAGIGIDRTREILDGLVQAGFVAKVQADGEVRYRATLMRAR